jgi:hypothetical protein
VQHPDQWQVAGGAGFVFEKPPPAAYIGVLACEPDFGDVLVVFARLALLTALVVVRARARFSVAVVEAFSDGYGGVRGVAVVVVVVLLSLVLLVLLEFAGSERGLL